MRTRILSVILCFSSSLLAQAAPPSIDLHSIDPTDMNKSVDPCTDFFEYANGNWRAQNPIPASMVRWSRRWRSGETIKDDIKTILDESLRTKAAKGSTDQFIGGYTDLLIGDYYGSCVDEKRVNAEGLKPLAPWLKEIEDAKDTAGLQHVMAHLHDIGVSVPFVLGGSQDPHEPTMIMADIAANSLSLPERDYYLGSEARFKEARDKFVEHVTKMFVLADNKPEDAAAMGKTVLAMETKFAEATLDPAASRDPAATDHKTTFAQLQTMAPHIRWEDYFEHLHLARWRCSK